MLVDVRCHLALRPRVAAVGVAVAELALALEIGALSIDDDASFTVRFVADHGIDRNCWPVNPSIFITFE